MLRHSRLVVCVCVVMTLVMTSHAQMYSTSGTSLHRNDDGYSGVQSMSTGFKFFGSTYTSLYVCTNGIISFGGGVSSYTPTPFPISSRPVVAPFWGDVDTRSSGSITYQQYTSGSILSTLTSDINAQYGSSVPGFTCTWAYVVSWNSVPAYPGRGSGNTFQAVLATNGVYSFVIYNYQNIAWTFGSASGGVSAQIGFDAGNRQNYYAHGDSRSAAIGNIDANEGNTGTVGRWMFRVDLTEIVPVEEVAQCDTGYAGDGCTDCADGYVRSGGSCVTNHCASHSCSNGAACVNGGSGYSCSCTSDYEGTYCTTRNYCNGQTCSGRGICNNGNSGYTCACIHSYHSGTNCETTNLCLQNNVNCANGGTCQTSTGSCSCTSHFTGSTCSSCSADWTGSGCSTRDYCNGNSCQNGATCVNGGSSYTCTCAYGYIGSTCGTYDLCSYNSITCQNGGTCQTSSGACTCTQYFRGSTCGSCSADWTGSGCQTRNYCNGNGCQNGATCVNGGSDYSCTCAYGYINDRCQTHDLCTYNSITCQNGGTCTAGTGLCTCTSHFSGIYCAECADGWTGSDCNTVDYCHGNECHNGATCVNGGSGYTCSCVRESNLAWEGTYCEVRDTCYETSPGCGEGNCINIGASGGHSCACYEHWCDNSGECNVCCNGWTGSDCNTVDHCYLHECINGATCVNGASDYSCSCVYEYTGNRCQTRDYCTTHLQDGDGDYTACQHNGTCVNEAERWSCTCFDDHFTDTFCESCSNGWTGNCYVIDHCYLNECENGATCINQPEIGTYSCTCPYEYTGTRCETRDWCRTELDSEDRLVCEHNATCMNEPEQWRCECYDDHFTNTYCEDCSNGWTENCYVIDYCYLNECENGATCHNHPEISTYSCECTYEYTGDMCEQYNYCLVQNIDCDVTDVDAVCVNNATGGFCDCSARWSGTLCQQCFPGWTGDSCTLVDYCSGRSCGTGTCNNDYSINRPVCACTDEYSGSNCETRDYCYQVSSCPGVTSECANNEDNSGFFCDFCYEERCYEHGDCMNSDSEHTCSCYTTESVRYYGDECQYEDYCVHSLCMNGGVCYNDENEHLNFACACTNGWDGKLCEFIDQCADSTLCDEGYTCSTNSNTTHVCEEDIADLNAQTSDDGSSSDDSKNGGMDPQTAAIIAGSAAGACALAATIFIVAKRRKQKEKKDDDMQKAFEQQEEPDDIEVEQRQQQMSNTPSDMAVEDEGMWE